MHVLLAQGLAMYGPVIKANPGSLTAVAIMLTAVVCRVNDMVYIEFPTGEPMGNVLELLHITERQHGVCFDLLDRDLWEPINGGTRIHGMFREDLIERS